MKGEKMMGKLSTGMMVGSKMRFSVVNTCFVVIVEKVDGDFHVTLAAVRGNTSTVFMISRWKARDHRKAANGFYKSPEVQRVIARV
jgi:hypothetical protein